MLLTLNLFPLQFFRPFHRSIQSIVAIILATVLFSCDTSKLQETPMHGFVGVWELSGRSMFEGIKVEIKAKKDGGYIGHIVELNSNKYVTMFAEVGDVWVSGIERKSNHEFILKEKKLASPLFSSYGISTTTEYKVEFIDQATLGLGSGSSDPSVSTNVYRRVE